MTSKKKFITSIKLIVGRLWIATVGCGLFVYDANTLKYEKSWRDMEGEEIYDLLHTECGDGSVIVIALTKSGLFSFTNEDMKFLHYQKKAFQNLVMNVGVVIEAGYNIKESELWVCSHAENSFFILNPRTLDIIKEVKYLRKARLPQSVSVEQLSLDPHNVMSPFMLTSIKHLQAIKVNDRKKIIMAVNWMLYLWDVETRSEEQSLNCMECCKKNEDSLLGK